MSHSVSNVRDRRRWRSAAARLVALIGALVLVVGLAPAGATAAARKAADDKPATRFGTSVSRVGGEDYRAAKRRVTRDYGAPRVLRVFHSGLPSPWGTIHRNLGRRVPLVVSFKADPRSILAGRHDAYLRKWFATAPTGRRTFWTYYHEPEDNIDRGEFSAAQYRAAWSRIAGLARAADNRRLRATLILMTWSLNPSSDRNWRAYYSAGDIDVLGWDGYNPYEAQGRYSRPSEMFGRAFRAARSVGLPFGIAEFGSNLAAGDNGRLRARWLRACARWLDRREARFVTYFDAVFPGENDFRLRDNPSRSAWRKVVSGR